MTTTPAGPSQRSFPAPGSSVPGAPPPLKRALTPADGDVSPTAPQQPAGTTHRLPQAPSVPAPAGGYTAAAAMLGIAVGLELSQLVKCRRHSGRRR